MLEIPLMLLWLNELMASVKTVHVSQTQIEDMVRNDNPWGKVVDAHGILKCHHVACKIRGSFDLYENNVETKEKIRNVDYDSLSMDGEQEIFWFWFYSCKTPKRV